MPNFFLVGMKFNSMEKKFEKVSELYNERFKKTGYDVKTVGWKDKQTQDLRFEILTRNLDLNGKTILDVGCGGGLLSEPMCRLGAKVTGIDASDKNIKVAKLHSEKNNLEIDYFCSSPEKFNTKDKFDVILNMEIVEHVEDVNFFLKSCCKLLKKNGLMFVATLNKTLKSYIFAIVGAEYVLRWLPIGTHEWEKFIKPEELISILEKNDLRLDKVDGMNFNLLKDKWSVGNDKSVNYIAKFIKN